MLVALSDHVEGNSTPSCSKATDPSRKFVIRSVAPVPLELVVRVDAGDREVSPNADARLLGSESHGDSSRSVGDHGGESWT